MSTFKIYEGKDKDNVASCLKTPEQAVYDTTTQEKLSAKMTRHEEKLNNAVEIGDYDPSLRAGVADTAYDVIADNTETETFTSRVVGNTSGGHAITKGNASVKVMKGNSIAWRQMVRWEDTSEKGVSIVNNENGSIRVYGHPTERAQFQSKRTSLINGHKYFIVEPLSKKNLVRDNEWNLISTLVSGNAGIGTYTKESGDDKMFILDTFMCVDEDIDVTFFPCVLDITLAFGSAIADTINNENDVAKLLGYSSWSAFASSDRFASMMAYSANGTLISNNATAIRTIGKNMVDESQSTNGYAYNVNGGGMRQKQECSITDYIRVEVGKTYHFNDAFALGSSSYGVTYYDKDKNIISSVVASESSPFNRVAPSNASFIRCTYYNAKSPMIHLGTTDATYELYKKVERPTLIKSIKDAQGNVVFPNGLLKAGDVADSIDYRAGKAVSRNEYRAYQSGDESLSGAVTDGTHTIVPRTTQIEYTFDPSHIDYPIVNGGVEELVAEGNVAPIVADITYPCSANGTIDAILERVGSMEDASGKIQSLDQAMQGFVCALAMQWSISPTKIGVVNLGEQDWYSSNNTFYVYYIENMANNAHISCIKYQCEQGGGSAGMAGDKIMRSRTEYPHVYLKDSSVESYSGGSPIVNTNVKEAMKGIYLFYEKA